MPIIDDLLREFPDLAPHREELTHLIHEIKKENTSITVDPFFVQQLRKKLMNHERTQDNHLTFTHFFHTLMHKKTFAFSGAALALLIALPLGYSLLNTSQSSPLATITFFQEHAFGTLSSTEISPLGLGSDASTLKLIPEDASFTTYTYSFGGDLAPYLAETAGMVYERASASTWEGSSLKNIADHFSAGPDLKSLLGESDLTAFTLNTRGHLFSADTLGGNWMLYPNWTNVAQKDWEPLTKNDIPENDVIIAKAKEIIATWGIDVSSYGEPQLIDTQIAMARTGMETFIPEYANVVFPSRIEDEIVYSAWESAPTGLTVTLDLHDLHLVSAFGPLSTTYNASSYALTQSEENVRNLLTHGGYLQNAFENTQTTTDIALNAPERILMEYTTAVNGTSKTLFVPALRFSTQENDTTSPKTVITIPLVQEIIDERMQDASETPTLFEAFSIK